MHIDGIKEISSVQGYEVNLIKSDNTKMERSLDMMNQRNCKS